MTALPSPDCEAGKHTACTGEAFDDEIDDVCACPCTCHPTPGWLGT